MQHSVVTQGERIILATIGESLSIEEWETVSKDILTQLQAIAPESGHLIVDMLQTKKHPINAIAIKRVTVWATANNLGSVTHIVNNRYTAILGDVVMNFFGKNYTAVSSLEEAYDVIKIRL